MTNPLPQIDALITNELIAKAADVLDFRRHEYRVDTDTWVPHCICGWSAEERYSAIAAYARHLAGAVLEDIAPLIAAQALEDARDAGATELLKLLLAEDDAQYIGGSSHGMGPIEACETVEGWLDSRAAKLREGAESAPLNPSVGRCDWKRLMLHGPDVRCELPRGHIGACSFDQPPSPDPLNEGEGSRT